MDEMEKITRHQRQEAWKKNIREKIGRDHLSTIQGYVVAGCVLDILDDIWDRREQQMVEQSLEQQKNRYNVFVYGLLRYPPTRHEMMKNIEGKEPGIFL